MDTIRGWIMKLFGIQTITIGDYPQEPTEVEARYWFNEYHSLLRILARYNASHAIKLGMDKRPRTLRYRHIHPPRPLKPRDPKSNGNVRYER